MLDLNFLSVLDEKAEFLYRFSDDIWAHPETAFTEFHAAERYCAVLRSEGFAVTEGLAGIPTAFSGRFGSGWPVIGILAEFDALTGLSQEGGLTEQRSAGGDCGHGCGHNLLGMASLGAALMTGTTVEIDFVKACSNTVLNDTLQRALYEKMAQIGVPEITAADEAYARELTQKALMEYPKADPAHPIHAELLPYTGQIEYECGSTDVGDVSWLCPTVQAKTATWAFGTPGHSWQTVTQGVMPLAHKMTLYAAKSLAALGAELMVNAGLLAQAKQEHRRLVGPEGYVCPIPKGVKPRSMDSLHK